MDRPKFSVQLSELLELPSPPAGAHRLEDLEEWDSFAVISFIALVDETYQVRLTPNAVARCQTVDDLAALVERGPADARC